MESIVDTISSDNKTSEEKSIIKLKSSSLLDVHYTTVLMEIEGVAGTKTQSTNNTKVPPETKSNTSDEKIVPFVKIEATVMANLPVVDATLDLHASLEKEGDSTIREATVALKKTINASMYYIAEVTHHDNDPLYNDSTEVAIGIGHQIDINILGGVTADSQIICGENLMPQSDIGNDECMINAQIELEL